VNNSARYAPPDFAGFRFGTLHGAGETSGGTSDTRLVDLALQYTGAGFDTVLSDVDDKAQRGGPDDVRARMVALAGSSSFAPFHVVAGDVDFDDRRSANLDGKGFWVGSE